MAKNIGAAPEERAEEDQSRVPQVKRTPRSIGHITPLYCKYDSDEEAEEERKVGTRPELDMSRKGMGSNY